MKQKETNDMFHVAFLVITWVGWDIPAQNICKKVCQTECQIECKNMSQIDCQNISKIECQNQKICQIDWEHIGQIECPNMYVYIYMLIR